MTVPSRKKTLLSRKEENLIARLRPEAMRLALAVSIHGLELAEWRREAGPKSRWSAHVKLKEHVVYQAFADASAALGAFLQTHIPKHWDISDWACRPARMGGEIRWAAKGGRGRAGHSITIDCHRILAQTGRWVGLIACRGAPRSTSA